MTIPRPTRAVAWAAATALLISGCSAQSSPEEVAFPSTTAESTSSPSPEAGTAQTSAPEVDAAEQTRADGGDADRTTAASSTERPPAAASATPTDEAPPTEDAAAAEDDATAEEAANEAAAEDPDDDVAPGPVADVSTGSAAGADGAEVVVYDAPGGEAQQTFANPTATGTPLTFMVTATTDGWVEVQLPVRPNGSTAWVPAEDVTVYEVAYELRVSTADNTLDLYQDGELTDTFSVATGTGETPTPLGTYYLTELIAPTNSGYGPFAYGISAFSDVLNEFGGGPGQVGLHGTDDADSIGRDVSHGCIRMSNEDITRLSELLPLATPIVIT